MKRSNRVVNSICPRLVVDEYFTDLGIDQEIKNKAEEDFDLGFTCGLNNDRPSGRRSQDFSLGFDCGQQEYWYYKRMDFEEESRNILESWIISENAKFLGIDL